MAATIVVRPTKPSTVIVGGSKKSGTPIRIDDSVDWGRVEAVAADAARDALKEMAVDTELSAESENPVQNKVIATELSTVKKSVEDLLPLIYAGL